jgi:predicted hotdog family 3-hydroxylacyl-ACP dehydratase
MTANPRDPMIDPHRNAPETAGDWRALIPHQGAMSLIDEIVAWDADTVDALAVSHRRADHPLRADGRLRAVHLCEYGAQAMAIHGGLIARASGGVAAPGFLVSLRAVELTVDRIDDLPGALAIRAEKLAGGDAAWQYAFRVSHDGVEIARGRAAVLATSD